MRQPEVRESRVSLYCLAVKLAASIDYQCRPRTGPLIVHQGHCQSSRCQESSTKCLPLRRLNGALQLSRGMAKIVT